MAFWRRIHCHFCGIRSPHTRSSSVFQFQCANCEAWNYLDANGDIADPPESVTAQTTASPAINVSPFQSRSKQSTVFCQTCLRNQHVYHEALANYLPDELHPEFAQYENKLPLYKRDLEKRYPQICRDCAPKAQALIHQADYLSLTNNAGRLMQRGGHSRRATSPPPAQSRDDDFKRCMRIALNIIGLVAFGCTLFQVLWHAYAILFLSSGVEGLELNDTSSQQYPVQPPTLSHCVKDATGLYFDVSCLDHIRSLVPLTLLFSLLLVWYNHGMKSAYHPTLRIESISGQTQHFWISLLVLVVRGISYYCLSNAATVQSLAKSELLAAHGLALVIIVSGTWAARNCIESHKWRLGGSIMPKPEERDVLGQYAGPASEKHVSQPSAARPFRLFADKVNEPFPISNLAPQSRTQTAWRSPGGHPPSPPGSDTTVDDPMDIEPIVPAQTHSEAQQLPTRHNNNGIGGWESLRTNLFSIEDEQRSKHQRAQYEREGKAHLQMQPQAQQNAFRGRLPQAPMSVERRMRNPISQVPQFKEIPVTQRQDFLQQMRNGIDSGKGFQRFNTPAQQGIFDEVEEGEPFSPAKSRTRGQLDLKSSGWNLPSDMNTATGLEEVFGSSFKIDDQPEVPFETTAESARPIALTPAAAVLIMALGLGLGFSVEGLRRPICLYLVGLLERLGY